MVNFSLSDSQIEKINNWVAQQNTIAVQRQKEIIGDNPPPHILECWDNNIPYSGASGGTLTYNFTPTSLGVVITVKSNTTQQILDVTDIENW